MNGKIVDTNILIYLSKKQLDFYKVALPNDKLFMSVITANVDDFLNIDRNLEIINPVDNSNQ